MNVQPGTRLGPYKIVAALRSRGKGETLADRIARGLPVADVVRFGSQITLVSNFKADAPHN